MTTDHNKPPDWEVLQAMKAQPGLISSRDIYGKWGITKTWWRRHAKAEGFEYRMMQTKDHLFRGWGTAAQIEGFVAEAVACRYPACLLQRWTKDEIQRRYHRGRARKMTHVRIVRGFCWPHFLQVYRGAKKAGIPFERYVSDHGLDRARSGE